MKRLRRWLFYALNLASVLLWAVVTVGCGRSFYHSDLIGVTWDHYYSRNSGVELSIEFVSDYGGLQFAWLVFRGTGDSTNSRSSTQPRDEFDHLWEVVKSGNSYQQIAGPQVPGNSFQKFGFGYSVASISLPRQSIVCGQILIPYPAHGFSSQSCLLFPFTAAIASDPKSPPGAA